MCEVCGQPGILLCCATCNIVSHIHCAGLQEEPLNDWMCAYCLADVEPSKEPTSVPAVNSARDDVRVNKMDKKVEAEAIIRATLRDKNNIQVRFDQIFEKSLPDLENYNMVHNGKEEVAIDGYDAMVFPIKSNNNRVKASGIRIVSKETSTLSRLSRAFNIVTDLYERHPGVKMVFLEGTSANIPGETAAGNMSALRACIQAAICDVEMIHPNNIVIAVMKLEVLGENSKRPDRADAHGVLVIRGTSEVDFSNDFQTCLIARGGMSKLMHDTDSSRVSLVIYVEDEKRL